MTDGLPSAHAPNRLNEALYTREEVETRCKQAGETAFLWMARAWLDRWKALGGYVALSFDADGNPKAPMRGIPAHPDYWTPSDPERTDLSPVVWLDQPEHHEGAVKTLEGLLKLCPGLKEAVRQIAGQEAISTWARSSKEESA